jgi:hypothetical protein
MIGKEKINHYALNTKIFLVKSISVLFQIVSKILPAGVSGCASAAGCSAGASGCDSAAAGCSAAASAAGAS